MHMCARNRQQYIRGIRLISVTLYDACSDRRRYNIVTRPVPLVCVVPSHSIPNLNARLMTQLHSAMTCIRLQPGSRCAQATVQCKSLTSRRARGSCRGSRGTHINACARAVEERIRQYSNVQVSDVAARGDCYVDEKCTHVPHTYAARSGVHCAMTGGSVANRDVHATVHCQILNIACADLCRKNSCNV